jgi:hypothetical protein
MACWIGRCSMYKLVVVLKSTSFSCWSCESPIIDYEINYWLFGTSKEERHGLEGNKPQVHVIQFLKSWMTNNRLWNLLFVVRDFNGLNDMDLRATNLKSMSFNRRSREWPIVDYGINYWLFATSKDWTTWTWGQQLLIFERLGLLWPPQIFFSFNLKNILFHTFWPSFFGQSQ